MSTCACRRTSPAARGWSRLVTRRQLSPARNCDRAITVIKHNCYQSITVIEEDAHRLITALRAGLPVVLPTDTVYGIAARADEPAGADAVYRLKGREARQPTALLAASLADLLAWVPELPEPALARLLPGPFTLVLPNPARRYPWLCGDRPEAIGVRVPNLPPAAGEAVAAVVAVLATSANEPGAPA